MMYLAVLGTQPRLSLAELTKTQKNVTAHSPTTATFSSRPHLHLGGSSKIASVIKELPTTAAADIQRYLTDNIGAYLGDDKTKLAIGFSVYNQRWRNYKNFCFSVKKQLRQQGHKPRIVLGSGQTLNSAQVLHNRLDQSSTEFIVSIGANTTLIGRSVWVQDIENYTKRDMLRPCRNMQVGMLPPKLAQIMINLVDGKHIYDPFCGSGVILQEALLMGRSATGSDLSPAMVECTRKNLEWLETELGTPKPEAIFVADARELELPNGIDTIVSEGYLGPVITKPLPLAKLEALARESDDLWRQVLSRLQPQLKAGTKLCLAIPTWTYQGGYITPAIAAQFQAPRKNSGRDRFVGVDDQDSLGYNQLSLTGITSDDLRYRRNDQFVGRQLMLLEKK